MKTNEEMIAYILNTLYTLSAQQERKWVEEHGNRNILQSIQYLKIIDSQLSLLSEDMDNSVSLHNMQ